MEQTLRPGEIYRHFKGNLYQIIAVAKHTETGEKLAVYQALYGDFGVYARPLNMFLEEADREKYPDAGQKYRFEKVDRAALGTEEPQINQDEAGSHEDCAGQTQGGPGPLLLSFVETGDFDVKLEILEAMRGKAGLEDLDILCESLDLPKGGGNQEERFRSIEQYLRMRKKFEGGRLR